jgi:hypothetical protein
MNDSLKVFLISSVKTAFISALIAGIAFMFGGNFVKWYLLATIGQYILFYLLNTFLAYKAARDARILQLKEAEIIGQNTAEVECAACKKKSEVLVKFGQGNHYICGHCNTKNTIFLFAETAVTTEPKYDAIPAINTSSTNGL